MDGGSGAAGGMTRRRSGERIAPLLDIVSIILHLPASPARRVWIPRIVADYHFISYHIDTRASFVLVFPSRLL
jgi:hypothetical protein